MQYIFKPKSHLEKFGLAIYDALVENFPRTYFVGGTVRNFLLRKKIKDIDIATIAKPFQVVETLKKYYFDYNLGFINMGVVIAAKKGLTASIATFRKDLKSESRYPKIKFVKSPGQDAQRRDFTINSLYLSPKTGKITDFFHGLEDLKAKQIRFIGAPKKRIKEDPLRIVRALRFALEIKFKLEKTTKLAIKNNFSAVKQLTKSKIEKEILKLRNKNHQKIIRATLDNHKNLDKYF